MVAAKKLGVVKVDFGSVDPRYANHALKAIHHLYQDAPSLKGDIVTIKGKNLGKVIASVKAGVWKINGKTQYGHELYINSSLLGDQKKFQKHMAINEALKFHPKGACSGHGVFTHEMGHAICTAYHTDKTHEIYNLFHLLSAKEIADNLSVYAKHDRHEFVAEAWSEYKCSPNPRPLALLVGQFIEGQIGGKNPMGAYPGSSYMNDQGAKKEGKEWAMKVIQTIKKESK